MKRVRRDNVILDIKDSGVQRYLDLGFDIVDEQGKILQACIPTDAGTLRMDFVNHTKRIEELTSENTKLKEEIKSLKAKLKANK